MKAFDFNYGPKLVSGPGTTARAGALLPQGRCLVVSDAQVLGLRLADVMLATLPNSGIEPVLFDAVEADPSRATLEARSQWAATRACDP